MPIYRNTDQCRKFFAGQLGVFVQTRIFGLRTSCGRKWRDVTWRDVTGEHFRLERPVERSVSRRWLDNIDLPILSRDASTRLELFSVKSLAIISRYSLYQELLDDLLSVQLMLVEVLLYVHRNRRFIRDGSPERPPRLSHSSWALMTVQFSPRGYLCAQKSPYALHPVSLKFTQRCLWNGSTV